jgi:hypothetical protein
MLVVVRSYSDSGVALSGGSLPVPAMLEIVKQKHHIEQ